MLDEEEPAPKRQRKVAQGVLDWLQSNALVEEGEEEEGGLVATHVLMRGGRFHA